MCRECFYFCVVVVKSALFPLRTNNLSHLGACGPMAEWERVGKDRVRRRVSNAIFSLLGCCFCFAWASACRLRSLSGPWHVHFTISWLFSFFFVLHSTAAGGLNRLFLPFVCSLAVLIFGDALLSVHVRPLKLLCCDSQFTSPPQWLKSPLAMNA